MYPRTIPLAALICSLLALSACTADTGASAATSGGICGTTLLPPANCSTILTAVYDGLEEAQQCTQASDCTVIKDPRCDSGGYPLAINPDVDGQKKYRCALAAEVALSCSPLACDWYGGGTQAYCNASGRCAFTSSGPDAGFALDTAPLDGGGLDTGGLDGGTSDAGLPDAGTSTDAANGPG